MEYDVLKEPWITVTDLNGKHTTFGIRDVLCKAHELRSLAEPVPIFEYGVFRLLCAFIMDAFRPKDKYDMKNILEIGRFDVEIIDGYIQKCREEGVSFDLFDKTRPFLQTPFDKEYDKKTNSVAKLNALLPSGNNHVHFDHTFEKDQELSYADALKGLCAINQFCCAIGAQGYSSTINGAPPIYYTYSGDNLFESLLFSCITENTAKKYNIEYGDKTIYWRNNARVVPKAKIMKTTLLQGMIFPCRRALLVPDDDGMVRRIYFCQGEDYAAYDTWKDPHVAYEFGDKGRASLKPQTDKEPWRNIDTVARADQTAPLFVEQLINYKLTDTINLKSYSFATSNCNYLDCGVSQMTIPEALSENDIKMDAMHEVINSAEKYAEYIGDALARFVNKGDAKQAQEAAKRMKSMKYSMIFDYFAQIRHFIFGDLIPKLSLANDAEVKAVSEEATAKEAALSVSVLENHLSEIIKTPKEMINGNRAISHLRHLLKGGKQ